VRHLWGERSNLKPVLYVQLFSVLLACAVSARADERSSEGVHGMVVSANARATDVGLATLKAGGNAIDAAVAVGYALAVVYPQAGNLGGGGFMTIRFADGRTTFLDFREKAPLAATATMFQDATGHIVPNLSIDSWLAVGVPGSIQGLDYALTHYGHLSREQILTPSIALARDGFTLTEDEVGAFHEENDGLAKNPEARAIFTHDGAPLQAGDRLVQPDLAASLETIQNTGVDSIRTGSLASAIADASAAAGGLITRADFESYRVRELTPVHCTYRGYEIASAPPPSSGGVTVCEILNIVEGDDVAALQPRSAAEVHLMVEAMRRAYKDRNDHLGDPDFGTNPIARLLDKTYAARLRATIDADKATSSMELASQQTSEGNQTTHYSVVDSEGNAVAVTTTLNGWFGAHRVAGHTGILLNNEMDDFTTGLGAANMFGLIQGAANSVAPGKTPLSSMAPTIVSKDGHLVLVTGSPGGPRIISTTVETIVNVIDHGMSIQNAVDAPRFHHQYRPDIIDAEPGALDAPTRATLSAQGYTIRDHEPWGHAESILVKPAPDANGSDGAVLFGANDHRAPAGAASGF
jgi:gamma-glutamyltranspeptidase / glutathione hydrolase